MSAISRVPRLAAIMLIFLCATSVFAGETNALRSYQQRLPRLAKELPRMIRAAEAVAAREIANPSVQIRYPWPSQQTFSDDFIARAGGLANWDYGLLGEQLPSKDVMIYAVRSWEEDAADVKSELAACRQLGWLTILIASRAGMPKDLPPVHYFIDNGARSGSKSETAINVLANITAGWMWHCEYVAALTRKGQRPGIYMSVILPGANEFNATLDPKERLYPCSAKIKAGLLAKAYLSRINWLIDDLRSVCVQDQISQTADIIVKRFQLGERVGIASCNHALPFELFHENKTPFIAFDASQPADEADMNRLRPGELLLWFGYVGASSPYVDYAKHIRDAGVSLVTSYVTDPNAGNNAPEALAHIEDSWKIGDAEVALPFPPGKMAPMSSINKILVFRMLDEAVSSRIASPTAGAPTPSL